jgi:hypothetical protein
VGAGAGAGVGAGAGSAGTGVGLVIHGGRSGVSVLSSRLIGAKRSLSFDMVNL